MERGLVLDEAKKVINGERQDSYGSPEDSFETIRELWYVWLKGKGFDVKLGVDDVAMMMLLLKVARENSSHKHDNIVDLAGYAGIYADLKEKDTKPYHKWAIPAERLDT